MFTDADFEFLQVLILSFCGFCLAVFVLAILVAILVEIWEETTARFAGFDSLAHQQEAVEDKLREVERQKREEEISRLRKNRMKLPNLQKDLEEYAKFIFPSLTKFKIDPVDEKLFISYPVGKRTRKLYYSSVFTRKSESIKQEMAKDYGAESEYIRKMESKEAERKDWLFDGRSCEIGTGFWGSGSCLNNAKRICPRCKKFICNTHTSNKSFGGSVGKSMCTTCASVLSDV